MQAACCAVSRYHLAGMVAHGKPTVNTQISSESVNRNALSFRSTSNGDVMKVPGKEEYKEVGDRSEEATPAAKAVLGDAILTTNESAHEKAVEGEGTMMTTTVS